MMRAWRAIALVLAMLGLSGPAMGQEPCTGDCDGNGQVGTRPKTSDPSHA